MNQPEGTGEGDDRQDRHSVLRARGIQGGVWSAASSVGSSGLSFVSFVILSRILGPEIFGIMAMVDASLAIGQRILESGLSEPLVQIKRLRRPYADTLFWSLQAVGAAFVLAFFLARGLLERYFLQDGLAVLLTATSFILYLQATNAVPRALLIRRTRIDLTAQARIGADLLGGAVGIWMAVTGYGVWSLVAMRLAMSFTETVILWSKARWRPRFYWSSSCFAAVWQFSASRGLTGLVNFVNKQVPRFILGRVAGAEELGNFVFARRVAEALVLIMQSPVRDVAMPAMAKLQDAPAEVGRLYRHGIRLTAVMAFPALAGCILAAPILVPLTVGNRWLAAVPLLQILALSEFRRPFNVWNSAVMRGLGKPQWLLGASALRALLMLALIFVLLPYRSLGVAVAILLGAYLSWPVAMRFVARLTGLGPGRQLWLAAPAFAATAVMAASLLALHRFVLPHLGLGLAAMVLITAGVAVYFGVLAVLGRRELHELLVLVKEAGALRKKRRQRDGDKRASEETG